MTREIKFRVWSKRENKFVSDIPNDTVSLDSDGILLPIEDYEVTQFTGLKDKNGKEIYEGDIVKGVVKFPQLTTFDTDENSNYKMCGKVFYDHSGFSLECIQALCQKDREGMVNYFDFIGGDGEIFDEMEIVGNEFENPELLTTHNK